MKTEKILEALMKHVNALDVAKQIKTLADEREKVPELTPYHILVNLIIDLKDDIVKENENTKGRGSALAACKRILKNSSASSIDFFRKAWIGEDGRQYLTDGFKMLAFVSHFDIPTWEEGIKLGASFEKNLTFPEGLTEVPLPSIATLKAHIKIEKATKTDKDKKTLINWDFGPGMKMVNAQYLLDMMEAIPDCKAYTDYDKNTALIYFSNDEGNSGCLCPIATSKNAKREVTADRYK